MDPALLAVWVLRLLFLGLLYAFLWAVGVAFVLDAVVTLGRDVNNSIVLEDDFVSATHARLTFRGRAWYVEDAGSTNGTFVNGSRIETISPLAFGDELQIGQIRLRLDRSRP